MSDIIEKANKKDEVFETNSSGRLKVNDSKAFLRMLTKSNEQVYKQLHAYGMKLIQTRASDIPYNDRDSLLNMAIVKATRGFDPNAGANILTYFTMKVRAEIKDYKDKRNSMHKKVMNTVDNRDENTEFCIQGQEGSTYLEPVSMESEEDKLITDDLYRRQITAFKMAFSGIPLLSQNILTRASSTTDSMEQIAYELYSNIINKASDEERPAVLAKYKKEVVKMRNQALSLVFSRVLRSNHLTAEEKEGILSEHDLSADEVEAHKRETNSKDNF